MRRIRSTSARSPTCSLSIEYTALNSFDYRQQVMQTLRSSAAERDRRFTRSGSDFADAWYDLHNPDQSATPMTVRFHTERDDFPAESDPISGSST